MIVNSSLQIVLAACTAVGVMIVSSLYVLQWQAGFLDQSDYADYWLVQLMSEFNKYAVGVLVPMGGLMILLVPKLRPAFDIILDVVNHFYFRPTDLEDALDDDDEFDIYETTFENGTMFFSRRDALHHRLKKILTYYRDEYDHQPELVLVSHSQGTMVAIEVLNDEDVDWLNNCFKSVTLITMGSPLNHLYQHYFGHCYPALDQPFWSSLRRRVDHWVNICRLDDFVGTDLVFPKAERPTHPTTAVGGAKLDFKMDTEMDAAMEVEQWTIGNSDVSDTDSSSVSYSNHPVGPRGHVAYWTDREVVQILRARVFDRPSEGLEDSSNGSDHKSQQLGEPGHEGRDAA